MPRPVKVLPPVTPASLVRHVGSWCVTGLLCGTMLLLAGCSRSFWRQNADDNTYAILEDKSTDPRWSPPRLDLQPDARSRFFDPYDPDCEPLPPDDPAAHTYMHWMGRNMNVGMAKVDQPWTGGVIPPWLYRQKPIRGWKSWHKFGDTLSVENPQWLEQFGLTPEQIEEQKDAGFAEGPGIYELTLPQAIELSYIHSRDFQLALESLYSASLSLTFERFRFDVRYLGFGGARPTSSINRNEVNGSTTSQMTNRAGISQVLPSGGQWIVEMANNTLWLFTGGNQSSTASTLSYSLVQPLLLGAGRHINLELLTQAERNALYAMRNFARFRQTFFVNNVSDYYTMLRVYQQILNQRYNIKLLTQQSARQLALGREAPTELKVLLPPMPAGFKLPQLPANYANRLSYGGDDLGDLRWTGPMTIAEMNELKQLIPVPAIQDALGDLFALSAARNAVSLQAAQLLTSLANNRSQLLSNELALQGLLDGYKFQLGLPPDMWVTLDTRLLGPFELISPKLLQLEDELFRFIDKTGGLAEDQLVSDNLQSVTNELSEYVQQAATQGIGLLDEDWERVQNNRETRFANLPVLIDDKEGNYRKSILDDYQRDQRLIGIIKQQLDSLKARLDSLKALFAQRAKNALPKPGVILPARVDPTKELKDIRERLIKTIQNMEVVEINLRVELITLNKFDMTIEEVVQTALENRVDLMNQRAIVMDARRKIEVIANTLRSQLNVTAAGDISTVPLGAGSTSPFEFRKDTSSFRLGLSFTAPLDQVLQRNNYRQALIQYQQARRAYIAAEDEVKIDVRGEWRQLTTFRTQFEINRKNMRTTAMQYDSAVEDSLNPGGVGGGGGGGGSNNAGLNLTTALNSVLNAQNNLIQLWVNYEINRLNIHQDMGIMQLDERGVWIDDYYQSQFSPVGVTVMEESRTEGVAVPDVAPAAPLPDLTPPKPAQP